MSDRPTSTIQEVAIEIGGTPTSEEFFQHDVDLAHEAALALQADVNNPNAPVDAVTLKNQRELAANLHGFERAESRRRLDDFFASKLNILTRHGLEGALSAEVIKQRGAHYKGSRREKDQPTVSQGYVVMFADVDGLKPVNDTLGHAVGDRLIARTGEAIRGSVRYSDMVGHLSGDEFVVVMPVDSKGAAIQVMEESLRNRQGETELGVLEKLKERSKVLRADLRREFPNFPADDSSRDRGKTPGRISAGYHFFTAKEFLARHDEYLQSKDPEKSFSQFLGREAEEKMYEMKRGGGT